MGNISKNIRERVGRVNARRSDRQPQDAERVKIVRVTKPARGARWHVSRASAERRDGSDDRAAE